MALSLPQRSSDVDYYDDYDDSDRGLSDSDRGHLVGRGRAVPRHRTQSTQAGQRDRKEQVEPVAILKQINE